jgi:hypothetical protein
MSFRRDTARALGWSEWLARNRAALIGIGIPYYVWETERRWLIFADHGFDHETGWTTDSLSDDQKLRLRTLIEGDTHSPRRGSAG